MMGLAVRPESGFSHPLFAGGASASVDEDGPDDEPHPTIDQTITIAAISTAYFLALLKECFMIRSFRFDLVDRQSHRRGDRMSLLNIGFLREQSGQRLAALRAFHRDVQKTRPA